MKDTPLPLMVWAMMTVGFPVPAFCRKGPLERVHVVAVHLDHIPAKGLPLFPERGQGQGVFAEVQALHLVMVHHRDQVIQAELMGD